MPRENRFFELFNRHAQQVVAASVVLSELLRGFTREESKRGERIGKILELEHAADKVTHETVALLPTAEATSPAARALMALLECGGD